MRFTNMILLVFLVQPILHGCFYSKQQSEDVITISITPWIGYYPLYFAIENNIDSEVGVDLRVFETLTLEDFSRANIKEHVDGFALTPMELVSANSLIEEPLHFGIFMDYSNGADVILAKKDIPDLKALKNKNVGFEFETLGHLFINLAHKESGILDPQYHSVNVNQIDAAKMFDTRQLDAYVTFPPLSNELLTRGDLHVIYSSSEIPYQIIDLLMVKDSSAEKIPKLKRIWFKTLTYIQNNPEKFQLFLARLMDISVSEVQSELDGLEFIGKEKESNIQSEDMLQTMFTTCDLFTTTLPECKQNLERIIFDNYPLTAFTTQ